MEELEGMRLASTNQAEGFLLLDERTKNYVNDYLPRPKTIEGLAEFFSAFSDQTRLKILSALSITKMCVSDLAKIIGINQTTVSHQLKLLRSQGAVRAERQGKLIFYSISDTRINNLMLSGVDFLGF